MTYPNPNHNLAYDTILHKKLHKCSLAIVIVGEPSTDNSFVVDVCIVWTQIPIILVAAFFPSLITGILVVFTYSAL